jgi:hypothetical protein
MPDIFETVLGNLAAQMPQILTTAAKGALDERGIFIAQIIHEERVEIEDGVWVLSLYALQLSAPVRVTVLRFLQGCLPRGKFQTVYFAPVSTMGNSIDAEIAVAKLWLREEVINA